jgi:hypothetical protein
MRFTILGEISEIDTFATGSGIREIARRDEFMDAAVGASAKALPACDYRMAQSMSLSLHWYEAAGIGRKELKIKHLL